MVGSRTLTATVGLVGSLLVSVALWWYFETFVFFLFLPFVPFLFREVRSDDHDPPRTCPKCEFRTENDAHDYCPRDGAKLER